MIYYLEDDEQIRNLALYTLEQTGHATRGFSRASAGTGKTYLAVAMAVKAFTQTCPL